MSDAQNSARTESRRSRGRPFPKGVSGNPGGRPRGFVQAIRATTKDGEELVRFMVRVLRGQVRGVRVRDRLEAATWLADRGFGKPVPAIERAPDVTELLAALHRSASPPNSTGVYDV
jgi:hypothetical protein